MQASLPMHRQRCAAWQQAPTHRRLIHVARAKRQDSGKPRGSDPLAGIEWWKDDSEPSTSTSTSTSQSDRRQPQRGRAGAGQQRSRRRDAGSNSAEDDEEVGWWERPRGAPGARQLPGAGRFQYEEEQEDELSPWQEERLKVAYAVGRRKMKVMDLAADLGLDRGQVLAWIQDFAALSEEQRTAALAPLGPAIAAAKQQAAAATEAAQRAAQAERQRAAAAALAAGAVPPETQVAAGPTADEAAAAGRAEGAAQLAGVSRRLSGEALRSLAGVYRRSPWPPREVVAGLWELHRLPREAVLGWFKARRAADGLPDNPRDMKAGGGMAAGRGAVPGDSPSWLDADALDALISTARVRGQPAGGAAKRAAPAELQQMLSARELVALRSALPSPRTYKGAKIRQELGIKDVEDGASSTSSSSSSSSSSRGPGVSPAASGSDAPVRIAGITFVVRDSGAAWELRWRRWRLAQGTPAQRLDFQRWLMRCKQQNTNQA